MRVPLLLLLLLLLLQIIIIIIYSMYKSINVPVSNQGWLGCFLFLSFRFCLITRLINHSQNLKHHLTVIKLISSSDGVNDWWVRFISSESRR